MKNHRASYEAISRPANPTEQDGKGVSSLFDRRITRRALMKGTIAAVAGAGASRVFPGQRPASAAAPAISKPVSIRYWTIFDPKDPGPRSVAQTQMIDLFKKKEPKVDVVVQIVPYGTFDQQLLQATAAGRGPDVARVWIQNLGMHVESKGLQPLDEFFKHWTKEQKEDFIFRSSWQDAVFDGLKMAFYVEHRVRVLWYRADLLGAKNVKPPRTMEELITVAKAVQTDQVAGFAVPLSRAVYAAPFVEWLMPTLWGLGGEFLNADETAAFNGDAGVRVYQWLYDLVHKHKVMPSAAVSWSVDNGDDMFKSGKLAMLPNGSMRVINARRAQGIGKNLQTAPLIADRTDRPCSTLVAGYTYTMTKDSKEKEAAWHFIEHMISPEAEVINAKIAGEMPTRKSTYKDPWFETDDAADMRQWMSYLANYGRSIRTPAKFMTLSDMLAVAVQDVIVNHVPPKRALDDVAKKWNAEIGKA